MEFMLNDFRYKFKEERVLKYIPSRRMYKWKHMTIRNCNGFIYFSSMGKDYKIHIETSDIYQNKTFILNIKAYDYCELDDLPIDYWKELDEYIDNELNPNPSNESFNDFMRGVFDTPDDCHYWSD